MGLRSLWAKIAARDGSSGASGWLAPSTTRTLGSLYAGPTLVCRTSRAEGLLLSCLEATPAGTPVVAADIPSVRELVDDAAAVLLSVDDVDRLEAAMEQLLERIRSGAPRSPRPGGDARRSLVGPPVVDAYRRVLER